MKTIEVLVTPDGQTRVETKGFTGSECREASKFIEQALGQQMSEQLTADYYATQSMEAQQQQRSQDM